MEKYTVFVASPSDVEKERNLLAKVIDEVNLTHGSALGYQLQLWDYRNNAYPSAQKPQHLINSIVVPYQIFIGIMWKRFGTPTPTAGSGTEEEYNLAYKAWEEKKVSEILFYFCQKPYLPENLDENDQFGKVLKFKTALNGKSFIWNYKNPADFEEKIRKHLCLLMTAEMEKKKNANGPKTLPDEETVATFKAVWGKMTPELQSYLSIPYNENRMRGDGGIKTKDLFAAMVTNPGPELQAVMNHIPAEALPKPLQGAVVEEQYIVNENPWLSHCISSSIKRLSKVLPAEKQLTALDVFIDIARNGTGDSVQLLRKHQITPEKIESIIAQENLNVLTG